MQTHYRSTRLTSNRFDTLSVSNGLSSHVQKKSSHVQCIIVSPAWWYCPSGPFLCHLVFLSLHQNIRTHLSVCQTTKKMGTETAQLIAEVTESHGMDIIASWIGQLDEDGFGANPSGSRIYASQHCTRFCTTLNFAKDFVGHCFMLGGWRSLWLTVNIWRVGHLFGHQCKELFLFLMHYLTVPGV